MNKKPLKVICCMFPVLLNVIDSFQSTVFGSKPEVFVLRPSCLSLKHIVSGCTAALLIDLSIDD